MPTEFGSVLFTAVLAGLATAADEVLATAVHSLARAYAVMHWCAEPLCRSGKNFVRAVTHSSVCAPRAPRSAAWQQYNGWSAEASVALFVCLVVQPFHCWMSKVVPSPQSRRTATSPVQRSVLVQAKDQCTGTMLQCASKIENFIRPPWLTPPNLQGAAVLRGIPLWHCHGSTTVPGFNWSDGSLRCSFSNFLVG